MNKGNLKINGSEENQRSDEEMDADVGLGIDRSPDTAEGILKRDCVLEHSYMLSRTNNIGRQVAEALVEVSVATIYQFYVLDRRSTSRHDGGHY